MTMIVFTSRSVHLKSTPLSLDGSMLLKESADIVILGVLMLTFEKHLCSVSSAAAQRHGIMRKSWRAFHDRSLLLRYFGGFVLPVLEYCSAVWCSAADSQLKLLERVVSSASLLAGGVLECNLVHRRSVAVLCMLFKIKSNSMHPLSGELPLSYVLARVNRGALVAHGHSFALPHCRTSQYRRAFVTLSLSLRIYLSDSVFDGVGLAEFKSC